MSQASPYDASVRRLRHLPQDRQCTVEPQSDDGSGQPDNDRIAASILKDQAYVGPPELAEMAAAENTSVIEPRDIVIAILAELGVIRRHLDAIKAIVRPELAHLSEYAGVNVLEAIKDMRRLQARL